MRSRTQLVSRPALNVRLAIPGEVRARWRKARLKRRQLSVTYRVTSWKWNAPTPESKRAPTTNAFKNLIDKQIFTNVMYDFDGQKLGLLRPNLS